MPDRDLVASLLGSDAPDAGCDGGMDLLDVYVEAELAGGPVAELFPRIAAHLDACADCREDHEGLLELVRRPPVGDERAGRPSTRRRHAAPFAPPEG